MRQATPYQPEIDGLRALAITPVVLYHAGLPAMRAGLLGVDIFFVISGFLITRMLVDELTRTGTVDLAAFYARRVRRLLPALTLVVAVSLVLGTLVLTAAGERQPFFASALASLAFVANIYFWRSQAIYAAPDAEWLPLLNMWTLSVEEQFYLVWPLLILLAAAAAHAGGRRPLPMVAALLLIGTAGSFALFLVGAQTHTMAAFYLAPTRAWEFALGGAVALAPALADRLRQKVGSAGITLISFAGVALIAAPMLGLARGLTSGVVPVAFGTAVLILALQAAATTPAGRILRLAPLVVIGKLSYSWYLWHWPLLSFARIWSLDLASPTRDLLVAIAALVPAALTFLLLEDPIRRRRPWPFSGARQTLAAGALLSLAVAAPALVLLMHAQDELARDPWFARIVAADRAIGEAPCALAQGFSALAPAESCRIGNLDSPPRMLVWGDSHAVHFVETIRAHAAERSYSAVTRTKSGCPPALGGMREDCLQFNSAVAAELPHLAGRGVSGILLASRTFGLAPQGSGEALRAILQAAQAAGLRVLLVAPVPSFKLPLPRCLARATPARCGASRAALENDRAPLLAALNRIVADFPDARLWDPWPAICSETHCTPVRDDVILYADRTHLTAQGARLLAPFAAPHLDWLLR